MTETATQFFEDSLQDCSGTEELRTLILALSLESLARQKQDSEGRFKPTQSPPLPLAFVSRHWQILQEIRTLVKTQNPRSFHFFFLMGNFPLTDGGQLILYRTPNPTIKPKLEDQKLDFLIDTGATFSTIHSADLSLPVTPESIRPVGILDSLFHCPCLSSHRCFEALSIPLPSFQLISSKPSW